MPEALLINPPIYDFSLYDLFHKPIGLMKIGRWLDKTGYRVAVVDALDINDTNSLKVLGKPKRKENGTGKFFRQPARFPPQRIIAGKSVRAGSGFGGHGEAAPGCGSIHGGLSRENQPYPAKRRYSRYGILEESLQARIASAKPDIVLITSGMTYWYPGVEEAVRLVREIHPHAPVVVGGVYASLLPDHCKSVVRPDYVVAGHAWDALRTILQANRLPVPTAEPDEGILLDANVWRGAGVLTLNEGCPLRCDYCASSLLHPDFNPGSGNAVFSMLEDLMKYCRIKSFAFYDDALLYRKEQGLLPFLEKVIDSSLDVSFHVPNALHLGLLDFDTALLMKRAGFAEIRLGYESSSPVFHQRYDGKVQQGDFEETVEILLKAGFARSQIIAYILAGLPGQPVEEVENSVRQVTACGVRASLAEYSPVPGTALWEPSVRASEFPIETEPLYHNNSLLPLQWERFTMDDLQRIKDLARALSPPAVAG